MAALAIEKRCYGVKRNTGRSRASIASRSSFRGAMRCAAPEVYVVVSLGERES